jgi:hypothetical protein
MPDNCRAGETVESAEQFAQNQRIIEAYASRWLSGIPSDAGRLFHVCMLLNVSTGRYRHPALEEDYSEASIHEALRYCHQELFQRFLEYTLQEQEWELRKFFAGMPDTPAEIAARWREAEYSSLLVPLGTPAYLRELFVSNLRVVLTLIAAEKAAVVHAG